MRSSLLTKIGATLLAALMLLPLASCATGDTGTASDTTRDSVTQEVDTENRDYLCDLPNDLNFGEEEVNLMCINAPGRKDELISEKLGVSLISDAVYERNTAVENQLQIKLVFHAQDDDVPAQVELNRIVTAGDRSIDIFTIGTNWAVTPAIEGKYRNLKAIRHIDLNKHYWSQDYNNMVTFTPEKKQFLATSPAALSLFRLTYLTIFNRDLFQDRKIPDLYAVVNNGEWTLDYQNQIITDTWIDTDGSGGATEDDFFGFVTGNCISVDAYAVSSDISLVEHDSDGYLYFDKQAANKMIDMSELVSELFTNKSTHFSPRQQDDIIGENYIMDKFANEQALMATTQFLSIESNIQSLAALNYGIVPMPKLNQEQKDYRTYVQDQVTSYGISAAIGDEARLTMLGAALEAMAYHSYVLVRPAYYDSTLSLRFMQDPESRSILDTMFETISFDYCYSNGVGGIRDELRLKLSSANPAVANRIPGWDRKLRSELSKINEALEKLS